MELLGLLDKVSQPLTVIGLLVLIIYKREQKQQTTNGHNPTVNAIKLIVESSTREHELLRTALVDSLTASREQQRLHQNQEESTLNEMLIELRRLRGPRGSA
jgi:hypothetical protein